MTPLLSASEIEALFTRSSGDFHFARWGRPIAPVAFGVDDATLATIKGALQAVAQLTNRPLAETDPELGSNFMMFFFRDWSELRDIPDLDRMIPDLHSLVPRLEREDANQYRLFRFDQSGGVRACFLFLRMDAALSALPADIVALSQITQSMLLWSDAAFRKTSPLADMQGQTILRPDIAALLRVAYDPVLPDMSKDPALALRIFARLPRYQEPVQ